MATKKKKAKPEPMYVHVVLDRSGSMASCASDAVGGYNTFVGTLEDVDKVSLTIFDSGSIDTIRRSVDKTSAKIAATEFEPRGSTPLYDAIGRVVSMAKVEAKDFKRVQIAILTDGLENCSREHTKTTIKALLEDCEKAGWLVTYLGANQDAMAEGASFGTQAAHTMTYNTQNLAQVSASLGRTTSAYRAQGVSGQSVGFTAEERAAAVKK